MPHSTLHSSLSYQTIVDFGKLNNQSNDEQSEEQKLIDNSSIEITLKRESKNKLPNLRTERLNPKSSKSTNKYLNDETMKLRFSQLNNSSLMRLEDESIIPIQ